MMQGFVNQSCEAIIRVAVGSANSPKQMVEALIDTGFTGFLSLPLSTITALGLSWHFRDVGTLGDGSEVIFEMYKRPCTPTDENESTSTRNRRNQAFTS